MAAIDDTDRKLLSLLATDADRSYGELAREVHLSAPAVHERVKRLKASGTIRSTVAIIDGPKIGRQLLAFVTVNTKKWSTTRQLLTLIELADVEEVHTITGENALLIKIRTRDTQSLENMLGVIHGIEGVEGTSSQIVLSTYLERGPRPEF
ncbi:Regulatory protein AsnC [compost metagenome]